MGKVKKMSKTVIIFDGHTFESYYDVPDLGSLVGVQNSDGTRSYSGENADASKLPVYDDLQAGSDATLSDASGIHVYHFDGSKWNAC